MTGKHWGVMHSHAQSFDTQEAAQVEHQRSLMGEVQILCKIDGEDPEKTGG